MRGVKFATHGVGAQQMGARPPALRVVRARFANEGEIARPDRFDDVAAKGRGAYLHSSRVAAAPVGPAEVILTKPVGRPSTPTAGLTRAPPKRPSSGGSAIPPARCARRRAWPLGLGVLGIGYEANKRTRRASGLVSVNGGKRTWGPRYGPKDRRSGRGA